MTCWWWFTGHLKCPVAGSMPRLDTQWGPNGRDQVVPVGVVADSSSRERNTHAVNSSTHKHNKHVYISNQRRSKQG